MLWRLAALFIVALVPTLAVAADALDSGLVGHWKLAGDVRDSFERNNHGVAKHVEFTVGPDGLPGSAALLNGRNAFVEVPNSESLQFGRQDFSVSVWVKPESKMITVFGDIVRRGSELKLFTNGVLSVSSQAPAQREFDLSNSEPLLIGFGAQTYFAGALSDLRLYGKALTDADVRRLSNKPSRKPTTP